MIDRDIPKPPCSPEQADAIFVGIGELTALQGENYGDSHSFGEVQIEVPDEVAAHFPATEPDSLDVKRTVYVTQHLDRVSGKPKRSGVVGMVTFSHKERRDPKLLYATHVNYHVITDDGEAHRLERHVTSTEHGPHRVAERIGRAVTLESVIAQLEEMKALRDRVEETRDVEQSLGLLIVSQPEAEQVIGVLNQLNGNE